ncbi:MAG TPA: PPOX class F420-dependent oxidoreductase [Polyangiaceae bacterium]
MATSDAPLGDERYVSLETFRKDGTGVKTPVWAAPLDGKLVVFTAGDSFKVKRLRNDARVRVAACDVRGNVRGGWHAGTGRIVEDAARVEEVLGALRRKYGFQMRVTDFFAKLAGRYRKRAYLELTLEAG